MRLTRLPERLRGYSSWLPETWRLVVIVDRDDDNCAVLKQRLETMTLASGLPTKSSPNRKGYKVINRIAVEELEAWYFGDWQAVQAAYPRVKASIPSQSKYRDPDAIIGGTWEAFERVLQRAGYYRGGLRKIEAARAIATHMDPARNSSRSLQALRTALLEIALAAR